MKYKNKIITLSSVIFLITVLLITPQINADNSPRTVRGYVYINGVITKPDNLKLCFPTQNITATLYNDGYYILDFSEEVGETGYFIVTYNELELQAQETVTIECGVYIYRINLTVTTPANMPPEKPSNPNPVNNSENISINPNLSVYVYDEDDSLLNVTFFNGQDNFLGRDTYVASGSRAEINWDNLDYNTSYSWYAIVYDQHGNHKTSDLWSFTTEEETFNHPPLKPFNPTPEDNSENISLTPTLTVKVVDPDADNMNVSFYNASNDQLIDTKYNVENNTYTSITWTNLAYNTSYSWYAIANDSQYETKSEIWTFTTKKQTTENQPPTVNITNPESKSIYFNGRKIFSRILFPTTLIFGTINISVNATDDQQVSYVNFYLNEELVHNTTQAPYNYTWNKTRITFFHKYTLKVEAYDNQGESANQSMIVKKFF